MSVAADELCAAAEKRFAAALGREGRRAQGLYYTPSALADAVVRFALRHAAPRGLRVLDPCAGAGAFLLAAARALPEAQLYGSDLDGEALAVTRDVLGLAGFTPRALVQHDALRAPAPIAADLLVSNPPYGHVASLEERAFASALLPALRGGEVDRYAAFLLRSLQLVRPGGTVALLIPDTWMWNARASALRAAVLAEAAVVAIADLGKPFASAKDTRVQALVLVRGGAQREVAIERLVDGRFEELAPLPAEELRAAVGAGFLPYRTRGERELCSALEAASVPLREVCTVGYGLRTGDNARFVARSEGAVPLCGGEDVVPFALRLRPKSLRAPTEVLQRSAARQQGPRLALQRIRTNSSAPWARWLEAAPVPAGTVCLDSLTTLATPDDELRWALLGLVHSVVLNRWHRLRTTDVNVKPSLVREMPAPRALLDPARRARLAALARARSEEVARLIHSQGEPRPPPGSESIKRVRHAPALERAIDAEVARLYGLSDELVEVAERAFWGERAAVELPRLSAHLRGMSDPLASVPPTSGGTP